MLKTTVLQFSISKWFSRIFLASLFFICVIFVTLPIIEKNSSVLVYEATFLNLTVRGSFRYQNDKSSRPEKRLPKEVVLSSPTPFLSNIKKEVNTVDPKGFSSFRNSSKKLTSNYTGGGNSIRCKQPVTNVAFLKVHKAGSTTVMNIFLRYGDSHNLNIVLPKSANQSVFNYLGYGVTIRKNRINKIPDNETYNILCNHVVYNKEAFKEILGPSAINIGIIRDPFTHFPSAAYYYGLINRLQKRFGPKMNAGELLSLYLKNPAKIGHALHTHNGMFSDFGLRSLDFDNESAINQHITNLDSEFALVMLTEMFDESLILMRRILCWNLKDILYVPLNINKKKEKHPIVLPEEAKQNLFRYNYADFKLYLYFKRKFIDQIRAAGDDFYPEVRHFKMIHKSVTQYCHTNLVRKFSSFPALKIASSAWNDEFTITSEECKFMMSSELPLLKQLMKKADNRYQKWLQSHKIISEKSSIVSKRNKIS